MRRPSYSLLGIMALTIVLPLTYPYLAQAQSEVPNPPVSAPVVPTPKTPAVAATNQVLQRNYLVHGTQSGSFSPAGTFQPVDRSLFVECPGSSGTCTIAAHMWVQTGLSSTFPNNYAVCLFVDGVNVQSTDGSNGCHYTEDTPSTGSFVEGSELNQKSGISPGLHKVQTFIFSNNGTPVYNFNILYQVYKP
jgi:hypothetical protein